MLGKRLDYQVEENKIHFFFEKEEAFLEVITESIRGEGSPDRFCGKRLRQLCFSCNKTVGSESL